MMADAFTADDSQVQSLLLSFSVLIIAPITRNKRIQFSTILVYSLNETSAFKMGWITILFTIFLFLLLRKFPCHCSESLPGMFKDVRVIPGFFKVAHRFL